jgi:hypothetical protein
LSGTVGKWRQRFAEQRLEVAGQAPVGRTAYSAYVNYDADDGGVQIIFIAKINRGTG